MAMTYLIGVMTEVLQMCGNLILVTQVLVSGETFLIIRLLNVI
jgi:hypothetical protein